MTNQTMFKPNPTDDPRITEWNLIQKAIQNAIDDRDIARRDHDRAQIAYCTKILRELRAEQRAVLAEPDAPIGMHSAFGIATPSQIIEEVR